MKFLEDVDQKQPQAEREQGWNAKHQRQEHHTAHVNHRLCGPGVAKSLLRVALQRAPLRRPRRLSRNLRRR